MQALPCGSAPTCGVWSTYGESGMRKLSIVYIVIFARLIHTNILFCFSSNVDPPIWYDTDVRLFEIQRM